MQIHIHTDKNIEGGERLGLHVQTLLQAKLSRFRENITRVEAHLSGESSQKVRTDSKKCVLEARPAGMQPLVVTHVAETLDHAISGAAEKMERLLDGTFGQLHDLKGRTATVGEQLD